MAMYSAGHLLFERDGVLMAQLFDTRRLERQGAPFPVVEQVGPVPLRFGWWAFSTSDETIVYGSGFGSSTQLAWFTRAGNEAGRLGSADYQVAPRLSPDQKRVAVARRDPQGHLDIWLYDLGRDALTRLTSFQPGINSGPVWSPDSSRIVFNSNRNTIWDLYLKASSGAGTEELLLSSSESKLATDWSSDDRFLLYSSLAPKNKYDLWVVPLQGDRKPVPILQTEFNELHGQFSPNVHWIAYQSDQSGRPEVYVQAFPTSGGAVTVSTGGGERPRWRSDGKELFYLSPDRKMMAVDVNTTATPFEPGHPRELFQTHVANMPFLVPAYDVTPDGQRFLIQIDADEAKGPRPLTVIMNWAWKK
jgi:Tol biopolymer transport system component